MGATDGNHAIRILAISDGARRFRQDVICRHSVMSAKIGTAAMRWALGDNQDLPQCGICTDGFSVDSASF